MNSYWLIGLLAIAVFIGCGSIAQALNRIAAALEKQQPK